MTKEEILIRLQQNCNADGISQFDFSRDSSVKVVEQKLLSELESEGLIKILTIALGYAVYRLL